MHLFFFTRGVKHQQDILLILLQGQFWQWKRKNLKTKKEEIMLVQGALRPSFLGSYEYVFPEECLSEVIAVLGLSIEKERFQMKWLRRMMGLKKIPKKNYEEAKKISTEIMIKGSMRGLVKINVGGAGVNLIGLKEDRRGEMYGYLQEAL